MSFGSVYALLAVGLVLTYKTSGVFNLAYGAQAFVAGRGLLRHCASGTTGRSRSRSSSRCSSSRRCSACSSTALLFRYLRTAPPVAQARDGARPARRDPADPEAVVRPEPAVRHARASSRTATTRTTRSATVFVNRDDLATIGVTVARRRRCSTLLFRYTALGLRMRAVVESPRHDRARGRRRRPGEHGVVDAVQHPRRPRRRAARAAVRRGVRASTTRRSSSSRSRPRCSRRSRASRSRSSAGSRSACSADPRRVPARRTASREQPAARAAVRRAVPGADPLAVAAQPARARRSARGRRSTATAARRRRCAAAFLTNGDPRRSASSSASSSATTSSSTPTRTGSTSRSRPTILAIIFLSITVITGMAGEISSVQGDVRGDRRVHDRAARDALRHVGARRDGHRRGASPRVVGALLALPRCGSAASSCRSRRFAFALFFENVMVKFDWVGGGALPDAAPATDDRLDRLRHAATRRSSCCVSSCS